jgi:hypothetical protein
MNDQETEKSALCSKVGANSQVWEQEEEKNFVLRVVGSYSLIVINLAVYNGVNVCFPTRRKPSVKCYLN